MYLLPVNNESKELSVPFKFFEFGYVVSCFFFFNNIEFIPKLLKISILALFLWDILYIFEKFKFSCVFSPPPAKGIDDCAKYENLYPQAVLCAK